MFQLIEMICSDLYLSSLGRRLPRGVLAGLTPAPACWSIDAGGLDPEEEIMDDIVITKGGINFTLHHLGYPGDETVVGEHYRLIAEYDGPPEDIDWPDDDEISEAAGLTLGTLEPPVGDDLEALLVVEAGPAF
jgi:hypothetical protein